MNETIKPNWMVYVSCMTYNHAPFIKDAMTGFCMQKTDFPYVCVIVDDCSTDGEQGVIKRYLAEHFEPAEQNIVKEYDTEDYSFSFARHKKNQNCYFAVYYLKYNHYSAKKPKTRYLNELPQHTKYIAMCEGDDYWIHPRKLQLQVQFLDEHPDYVLCFHDVKYIDIDKNFTKGNRGLLNRKNNLRADQYDRETVFNKIVFGEISIQTLSIVCRTDARAKVPRNNVSFMMGDTPLWLDLSQLGKIKYIDQCMGVYNIHAGSSTHSPQKRLRFSLSKYEMRVYYYNKYNYPIPKTIKKQYNKSYIDYILIGSNNNTPVHTPMYEPFALNVFERAYTIFVLNTRMGRWLYRYLFFHVSKKINWLIVHLKMLFKVVYNSVN